MILILKYRHEDLWKRGFVLPESPLPPTLSVMWLGGEWC